jgi:hypothetical protein
MMANGRMPTSEEIENEIGRAIAQPTTVSVPTTHAMDRITDIVSEMRVAAQECSQAGNNAEQQLLALAEDIEKEAHHRLTEIIREAQQFWNDLERRMVGHSKKVQPNA